jgi:hypothetical protein
MISTKNGRDLLNIKFLSKDFATVGALRRHPSRQLHKGKTSLTGNFSLASSNFSTTRLSDS